MSIELNLAVMFHGDEKHEVQPCQGTTCAEASKEWESDVIRVCQVILKDEGTITRNAYSHMESAWEAIEALDEAYDYPCIRDMVMHFFKKGFEEGMKHQANKEVVPVTVIQEVSLDDDPKRRTHN
jgi:hypothetical protein